MFDAGGAGRLLPRQGQPRRHGQLVPAPLRWRVPGESCRGRGHCPRSEHRQLPQPWHGVPVTQPARGARPAQAAAASWCCLQLPSVSPWAVLSCPALHSCCRSVFSGDSSELPFAVRSQQLPEIPASAAAFNHALHNWQAPHSLSAWQDHYSWYSFLFSWSAYAQNC